MIITLIAALNRQRVIGRGGGLPWHYPQDMRHFMRTTMGAPCIMGRRTYESFPRRPLPGRLNLVLTRREDYELTGGALRFDHFDAALAHCRRLCSKRVFICGGQSVYECALPLARRMVLTHIPDRVDDGDTFFPAWDRTQWRIVGDREEDGLRYVTYERAPPPD